VADPEVAGIPPAYQHVVRGIRQAQYRGLLSKDQVEDMIDRLRTKAAQAAGTSRPAAWSKPDRQ
jgi:hypothetical protein